MPTLALVLDFILTLLYFIVFARIVIGLIETISRDWTPRGFTAVLCELVFSITDPPLRFIGKFVPPLRIANVALDLSPLILLLGITFLQFIVSAVL